jgi:hypothetical protein
VRGQPGMAELFDNFGMDIDDMPRQEFPEVIDTRAEWGERVRRTGDQAED